MLKRQLRRSQKIPSIKYTSRRLPMCLSTVSERAYNLTSQSPKGLETRLERLNACNTSFSVSCPIFFSTFYCHREGIKTCNCSSLERLTNSPPLKTIISVLSLFTNKQLG
jgi:hypothetical protein